MGRRFFLGLCWLAMLMGSSLWSAVTATIVPSRTSGVAPLAVYFDASDSTASGVTYPFHQLSYEWDFDASNTDSADPLWGPSGLPKEWATGPAAAHVFEVPGTYTVTLSVRKENGETDSASVTITVSDPDSVYSGSDTICFSSTGNFAGVPSGASTVTTSSLATVMSYAANGKRLLLRRGETFSTSGGHTLTADNLTIGAFGAGSAPATVQLTGNNRLFRPENDDLKILDLQIDGPGSGLETYIVKPEHRCTRQLFLRLSIVPGTMHGGYNFGYNVLEYYGEDLHDGIFIVDNTIIDVGYGQAGNTGFLATRRLALLGNHFEDAEDGEHILRIQHVDRGVISSNYLSRQQYLKNVLTIRSNRNNSGENCLAGCGEPTRQVIVSDNIVLSNEDNSIECTTSNAVGDQPAGEDFIFERNYIAKEGSVEYHGVQTAIRTTGASSRVTIRNNLALMDDWQYCRPFDVSGTTEWIYNNTAYTADAVSNSVLCVKVRGGSGHTVFNNLLYAPNATGSKVMIDGTADSSGNNVVASTNPFVTTTINGPEDFALNGNGGNPALDAGAAVPVFRDYALALRPHGGSWDVGAYEYTGGGSGPVAVTGVSLSPSSVALTVGQSQTLSAVVTPSNATNQAVSWTSSNDSVASVDGAGIVTAVSAGSATITVTTSDGGKTDTAAVTVTAVSTLTNVALNQSVTASDFQDDGIGYQPPGMLVDGSTADADRWSANGFPQWAEIDLGGQFDLGEMRLHPYQNRAYQYIIEVSADGSNYATVVNRSSNTTGASVLTDSVSVTGRYVRLTVSGASGYGGPWVSINELEVYGEAASGAITAEAWWLFENNGDDSQGNHDLSLRNGATFSTDSIEGSYSLSLDGTNDYASISENGAGFFHEPFTERTIAGWIKVNATNPSQVILDEGGATNGIALRILGGELQGVVADGGNRQTVSTTYLSTDWNHVALVYDNGELTLFLNAVAVDSVSTGYGSVPTHTSDGAVGARRGDDAFNGQNDGAYFGGLIDDLLVTEVALTAGELESISGVSGGSSGPSPVALWNFDNDATDSANSYDLTLQNGAGFTTDSQQGSHSLLLDGSNDFALISDTETGFFHDAFEERTVACWIKADTTSGARVIYDEGGGTNGVGLRIVNGYLEAGVASDTSRPRISVPFTSNAWTFIALVYDYGELTLFVNGSAAGNLSTGFGTIGNHTSDAAIGGRRGGDCFGGGNDGDYFDGQIDSLSVFNVALTSSELDQLD